jgi:hypothetical protein
MAGPRRRTVLRAVLPVAILTGAMLLTACGTAAPTTSSTHGTPAPSAQGTPAPSAQGTPAASAQGTPAAQASTLCANPGAVVGLLVSERSLHNGVQEQAGQSGLVSAPSAAAARAIAAMVCGLPPVPGAQATCKSPALVDALVLTFRTRLGALPAVTIQDTGCFRVIGAGPVRWAGGTPALTAGLHAIVHHEPPVVSAN